MIGYETTQNRRKISCAGCVSDIENDEVARLDSLIVKPSLAAHLQQPAKVYDIMEGRYVVVEWWSQESPWSMRRSALAIRESIACDVELFDPSLADERQPVATSENGRISSGLYTFGSDIANNKTLSHMIAVKVDKKTGSKSTRAKLQTSSSGGKLPPSNRTRVASGMYDDSDHHDATLD